MSSPTRTLAKKGIAHPPKWLPDSIAYEVLMGSTAYGVTNQDSDWDVYGFAIPPKRIVFPHTDGYVYGFGAPAEVFEQYIEHHLDDTESGKQYDLCIYSIVKYFWLCLKNNPNMVDSLFVPANLVLASTPVGRMVREKRHIFLHKGSWHQFKGYSYSQLHKMNTKTTAGKRQKLREQFGFDVKFGMHVVRLLYEVEMILAEHDLDLQRHKEHLKAIRRGEVSEEEIRKWASDKESNLEKLYHTSTLPYGPRREEIRQLLLECLEHHYGSLDKCVVEPDLATKTIDQIAKAIDRYNKLSQ